MKAQKRARAQRTSQASSTAAHVSAPRPCTIFDPSLESRSTIAFRVPQSSHSRQRDVVRDGHSSIDRCQRGLLMIQTPLPPHYTTTVHVRPVRVAYFIEQSDMTAFE